MCLVNVHFHLGAEHRSEGFFDVSGVDFFNNVYHGKPGKIPPEDAGWMCSDYDATDEKFTTDYEWKYCEDMHVGMTYEIHWPHSSAGHCGRLQDGLGGIFCYSHTPEKIGVEGQVFTIVNDDAYDVEDL